MEGYRQPEGIIMLDILGIDAEDNDYMEGILCQLLQRTEEVKMLRGVILSGWETLGTVLMSLDEPRFMNGKVNNTSNDQTSRPDASNIATAEGFFHQLLKRTSEVKMLKGVIQSVQEMLAAELKSLDEPPVMNGKVNNKSNDETSRAAASDKATTEAPETISATVERTKNKKPNNQTATESTMPETKQTDNISRKGEAMSTRNTNGTYALTRQEPSNVVTRPAKESGSDQPSKYIPTKEKEIQQSENSGKSSNVSTTRKQQVAQASSSTPSPFAWLKKTARAIKPEPKRVQRKPDAKNTLKPTIEPKPKTGRRKLNIMDILKPTPTPASSGDGGSSITS